MRTTEEIIRIIESNSQKIEDKISKESIDVYNFLNLQFNDKEKNIEKNYLFQFVYRSFYRIDNAGLTSEFKTEYFKILQEYRYTENFDFFNILKR